MSLAFLSWVTSVQVLRLDLSFNWRTKLANSLTFQSRRKHKRVNCGIPCLSISLALSCQVIVHFWIIFCWVIKSIMPRHKHKFQRILHWRKSCEWSNLSQVSTTRGTNPSSVNCKTQGSHCHWVKYSQLKKLWANWFGKCIRALPNQ